jgi:hypothetical protein
MALATVRISVFSTGAADNIDGDFARPGHGLADRSNLCLFDGHVAANVHHDFARSARPGDRPHLRLLDRHQTNNIDSDFAISARPWRRSASRSSRPAPGQRHRQSLRAIRYGSGGPHLGLLDRHVANDINSYFA